MPTPSREPAAYAEAVRLVIAALVGLGWVTIRESTVNSVVTAVGALASIILTVAVRANVTPVTPPPPLPDHAQPEE
jgi:hypothetical protein